MNGRILPIGELAEFGKSDAVALTLLLTTDEALTASLYLVKELQRREENGLPVSTSVRKLLGYLQVIADPSRLGRDMVNTDGRTGATNGEAKSPRQPIGYKDGIPVYDRL